MMVAIWKFVLGLAGLIVAALLIGATWFIVWLVSDVLNTIPK